MNAVDTNILLYVHDPRDAAKQSRANYLLATEKDLVLVWQVACEYLNASRKLAPLGFNVQDAFKDIASFQRTWRFLLPDWPAIARSQGLLSRFSLSIYDSMLIAVCLESGVQRLYSEDFSAYQKIDTLEIINPFAP